MVVWLLQTACRCRCICVVHWTSCCTTLLHKHSYPWVYIALSLPHLESYALLFVPFFGNAYISKYGSALGPLVYIIFDVIFSNFQSTNVIVWWSIISRIITLICRINWGASDRWVHINCSLTTNAHLFQMWKGLWWRSSKNQRWKCVKSVIVEPQENMHESEHTVCTLRNHIEQVTSIKQSAQCHVHPSWLFQRVHSSLL